MTTIPQKTRKQMSVDPEYTRCALQGLLPDLIGTCAGRVTREHALYYASKKVQEQYAIPPICAKHHGVDEYQDGGSCPKEVREWVALNRATDDDLRAISKAVNYFRKREVLNQKYGVYVAPLIPKI